MTWNWLVNFDDSKRSVIRLADNRTIAAQGMGDVLISKKDGSNALLSDVLFVPGMKSNLVSIGQLVEKGFKLKCEERVLGKWDLQHSLPLLIKQLQNSFFTFQFKSFFNQLTNAHQITLSSYPLPGSISTSNNLTGPKLSPT